MATDSLFRGSSRRRIKNFRRRKRSLSPSFRNLLLVCLTLSSPVWAAGWDAIGPFGGSAAVIQVDPHHRGTVLAGTSNAQVFRSDDDGDSWHPIRFPAQFRATLHALVVDPQTPGVYLAGLSGDDPAYAGIFRSADDGQTWHRLPEPDLKAVWSIAVWPRDSRVLAAGTEDGVFLTRDAGENWMRISPRENRELQPVVSLAFDPTDSKILYAGTPHLPWKTANGGVTWNSVHTGMLDDSDVFSIHVDAHQPLRVFASACSGIYRSSNAGANWTKLTGAVGSSYRTYQITQDPTEANILYAGTTFGLSKSVDGGASWRRMTNKSTRSIAFDPFRPGRIFVATDEEGLFRSDDRGGSFQAVNRGFVNRRLGSLAASGQSLYATSLQNSTTGPVFRWSDSDHAWAGVDSVNKLIRNQVVKIVSANPQSLYIVTINGLVASTDSGRRWSEIAAPPSSRLTDLLVSPADSRRLFVGTERGVFQTENAGQTWHVAQLPAVKSVTSVSLTPAPRLPILLSSSSGVAYETTKHSVGQYEINGVVATDHNGFLAATSSGLMTSDDVGMKWLPLAGILEGSTVTAICKHPTHPGVLFAAKFGVIFGSKDEGRSWTRLTEESDGTEVITALQVAPEIPDRIFALTRNRGVYSTSLTALGY